MTNLSKDWQQSLTTSKKFARDLLETSEMIAIFMPRGDPFWNASSIENSDRYIYIYKRQEAIPSLKNY
jgi:hypothetical protein